MSGPSTLGARETFSAGLKSELMRTRPVRPCCRTALLSAVFHTAGSLSLSRGGVSAELSTRTEPLAAYAIKVIRSAYPGFSEADYLAGEINGSETVRFSQEFSGRLLTDLGILEVSDGIRLERGIAPGLAETDCCRKSYIKGAYLGCGTIKINRSSGYHLEFGLTNEVLLSGLAGLLNGQGFRFKYAERESGYALYLKDGDQISDFLAYLGASVSVLELQELLAERERSNALNRRTNCYVANVDKSVAAAIRQVGDISILEEKVGLESLDEDLKKTAETRLDHPDASMEELAKLLGISKSGANHRLRRLAELARKLRE